MVVAILLTIFILFVAALCFFLADRQNRYVVENAALRKQIGDLEHRLARAQEPLWEIVCPDGHVRHYPYLDKGAAKWEAGIAEKDCQFLGYPKESVLWLENPCCFDGKHTVRKKEL